MWETSSKRVWRMCKSCCTPWAPYPILFSVQKYLWWANESLFAFLKLSQTWCNHFRIDKYQSLNVYQFVLSSADYWWWYVYIHPSEKACLKKSYYVRKNVPFPNCSKTPQEASIANNPPLTYQWCIIVRYKFHALTHTSIWLQNQYRYWSYVDIWVPNLGIAVKTLEFMGNQDPPTMIPKWKKRHF